MPPRGYKKPSNFGRKCKDCGKEINETNLVFSKDTVRPICKDCNKARYKEYPSTWKQNQRYRITRTEYEKKVELQLGGCAICKYPCKTGRGLAVDHDHKTDKVRDLLCYRCNIVLGLVNEDEELLFAIIEYLKKHEEKMA